MFASIPEARARKTISFLTDRDAFMLQLSQEIGRFTVKARKAGFKPCVRLNGTSDIQWERIILPSPYPDSGKPRTLFDVHPEVQFYDYTKHPGRFNLPRNYTLTYSLAETDQSLIQALAALSRGRNVAVVFDTKKGQPLPARFCDDTPVIDGDVSDLRFLDPTRSQGVIIGLRAKGRAIGDTSGFVQKAYA